MFLDQVNAANCDCTEKYDAKLVEIDGGKLEMPVKSRGFIKHDVSYRTLGVHLITASSGNPNRKEYLTVSFCPFCGVKYKTTEEIFKERGVELPEVSG